MKSASSLKWYSLKIFKGWMNVLNESLQPLSCNCSVMQKRVQVGLTDGFFSSSVVVVRRSGGETLTRNEGRLR